MPGWCCCDQWELWDKWDAEDYQVAPASLHDQILRLRNHPSVLAWMNGSDFAPPAKVEKAYLDVLEKLEWSKPILSNATDAPGPVSGPSGVKMKGPYDYVPPSYWLTDTKNGGAFGFATEIGPGGAVPPVESLKKMLPADHLWPIDDVWSFHAGGDEFKDIKRFTEALEGRYGKATGVDDYARKAQALTYESQRAMIEGYGRNKYTSTGVIQWMLNNAWPSLIWHLYDYYLRPGGGYYGTKKACEPLHVQFSYDDRSVVVVNDLQQPFEGLKVTAEVFDLGLASKFSKTARSTWARTRWRGPSSSPRSPGLTRGLFPPAEGGRRGGKAREHELLLAFHQRRRARLEEHEVVLHSHEAPRGPHGAQPAASHDAVGQLPLRRLGAGRVGGGRGGEHRQGPGLHDPSPRRRSGEEILPVFWEDNYFELFPGEKREVRVEFPRGTGRPSVTAEAWNATLVK